MNLKHITKRGLSVFLALVMCLSLLPTSAFATEGEEVSTSQVTEVTEPEITTDPAKDSSEEEIAEEVPEEVQMFLDAVAAIPADIDADNAEEAGELVNAAFDAYEVLVDAGLDEYGGVADALAEVEAAYAAVDEVLELENSTYSGYYYYEGNSLAGFGAAIGYDPKDTSKFPKTNDTDISVIPWDFHNSDHAKDYYYYTDYRLGYGDNKLHPRTEPDPDPVQSSYFEKTYNWTDLPYYAPLEYSKTTVAGTTGSLSWRQGVTNFNDSFGGLAPTIPSVYLYRLEEVEGAEYITGGRDGITFKANDEVKLESSGGPVYKPTGPYIQCDVPVAADAPDGAQIQVRFRLAMGYEMEWQASEGTYNWYVQDFILNLTVGEGSSTEPEVPAPDADVVHHVYMPAGTSTTLETYVPYLSGGSYNVKNPKINQNGDAAVAEAGTLKTVNFNGYNSFYGTKLQIPITSAVGAETGKTTTIQVQHSWNGGDFTCVEAIVVHIIAPREQQLDVGKNVTMPTLGSGSGFEKIQNAASDNTSAVTVGSSSSSGYTATRKAAGDASVEYQYRYIENVYSGHRGGYSWNLQDINYRQQTVYVDVTNFTTPSEGDDPSTINGLDIQKAANPMEVVGGDEITYTITVTNDSTVDKTVTVTDPLPNGVKFKSFDPNDSTVSIGSDGYNVTWKPTVPAGGKSVLKIICTVDNNARGYLTNVARMVTEDGSKDEATVQPTATPKPDQPKTYTVIWKGVDEEQGTPTATSLPWATLHKEENVSEGNEPTWANVKEKNNLPDPKPYTLDGKTYVWTKEWEDGEWNSDKTVKTYKAKYRAETTPTPATPKLTKLEKVRLTAAPSGADLNLNGVTVNYDQNVVFVGNNPDPVTLLYRITVTGTEGADYKVIDEGATWVGGSGTADSDVITGTLDEDGSAVIYVTKTFNKNDVDANGKLTNNATLESNGTTEKPTDGPEGNNGKDGDSSDAAKKYNVTVNYKTDEEVTLKNSDNTMVDEGGDFSYSMEQAKARTSSDVSAVVIPQSITKDSKTYVLDEVASAEGLKKLSEAKNIHADVEADIIYSLDEKGTIGTNDEGNPTDTPDNIPDKYQVKVTLKVVNGEWNEGGKADIVKYLEKYGTDGETYDANGTAILGDIIPAVGQKPDSGYDKDGSWDTEPSAETIITNDAEYTYTYTKTHTHDWDNGTVTKEPTCIEKGLKTFTCSCDATKTEEVAALGHKFEDATWTDNCTTHVDANCTGHSQVCTRCEGKLDGGTKTEVHTYDDWTVTKQPTATERGEQERTCTICRHKQTQEIAALGEVTITVRFEDEDNDVVGTETKVVVTKGSQYDVTDETKKIPEGYEANGTPTGDSITGTADVDKTITVPVKKTPDLVTVTWVNGYNDTAIKVKNDHVKGAAVPQSDYPTPDPTRSGYAFTGWGNPVTDAATGNITITAQWRSTGGGSSGNGGGGGGGSTNIPDNPTPLDPGTQITDPDVPLAPAPGLNATDHFAYIIGYPDGTVRPQGNITRAEVATIFFRLMTDEFRTTNWASTNSFPDVASASLWYNNAVSTAAKAGLLKGKEDGNFHPSQNITRAEFATIAARFLSDEEITAQPFPDTVGHWAEKDIIRAVQAGWIKGNSDGNFRPNDPITRAEAMTLVNRMLDRVPDKDHMLSDMVTWPDNPESAWFYEAVQEATNSHDYERDELGVTETWTGKLADRDWSALEKEWSNAASSTGSNVADNLQK